MSVVYDFNRARLGLEPARHFNADPARPNSRASSSEPALAGREPSAPPSLVEELHAVEDPYRLACKHIEESYERELAMVREQIAYLEARLAKAEGRS